MYKEEQMVKLRLPRVGEDGRGERRMKKREIGVDGKETQRHGQIQPLDRMNGAGVHIAQRQKACLLAYNRRSANSTGDGAGVVTGWGPKFTKRILRACIRVDGVGDRIGRLSSSRPKRVGMGARQCG